MSDELSTFQRYWARLKAENPEKYEIRLATNRDRVFRMRHDIYADKAKHATHLEKQRAKYAAKQRSKNKSA